MHLLMQLPHSVLLGLPGMGRAGQHAEQSNEQRTATSHGDVGR